jgi:hypothetical protein
MNFSYIKQYSDQSGLQLWGMAYTSNIEILEHFQSKAVRIIVDLPWYVPNTVIWRDLQTQQLKKKSTTAAQYSALLSTWPNDLLVNWHGATRQQAIAVALAKWSAYQIPSLIAIFVVLVLRFGL